MIIISFTQSIQCCIINFPWDAEPCTRGWDDGYYWDGGGQLDLAATVKNVGIKNLNVTIIGKSVQNAVWYTCSAMDSEHTVQIAPQYFESKVSYLCPNPQVKGIYKGEHCTSVVKNRSDAVRWHPEVSGRQCLAYLRIEVFGKCLTKF